MKFHSGRQTKKIRQKSTHSPKTALYGASKALSESALNLLCSQSPPSKMITIAMDAYAALNAIALLHPQIEAVFYHYDSFRTQQAESASLAQRLTNFRTICAPKPPYESSNETFDLAMMELRRDGESGLWCELIRMTFDLLAPSGKLLVFVHNPKDQWVRHQLEKVFGNLSLVHREKTGLIYSVKKTKTDEPLQPDIFIRKIPVDFGDIHWELETCYGVFSAEALDTGSMALLELLTTPPWMNDAVNQRPNPCHSILDLGCGWGAMGLITAKMTNAKQLTMIDANARAMLMAQCNIDTLRQLGFIDNELKIDLHLESEAQTLQANPKLMGTYDLVISNPPYATEFRVTDLFIRTAHRALRPGGNLWLVGKDNTRMVQRMREVFGNETLMRRRGYWVVMSSKPNR